MVPPSWSRGNISHNINHPPAGCFVSGRVVFAGFVWGCVLPFNRVLAKPWGCGRFSSPLRNSKDFGLFHSTDDTPSVSLSLDSSLREGAGEGLYHSTGYSLKSWVSGDFHRPYETQKFLHFTIQCTARKPQDCGRFSSPLRRLRSFYILPFGGGGNNLLGRLVKIFEKYLTNGQMCASIAPSIFESGLRRQ